MSIREQRSHFPHRDWSSQSPDFNPIETYLGLKEKTEGTVPLSCHQYNISAQKMNATLDGNESCDVA